jgi:glutamate 5-kinase
VSELKSVVVKVGSSTLVAEDGTPDREYIDQLVDQIARVREQGVKVVLVTSGAIAAGKEALGKALDRDDIPSLQAAASIGQVRILGMYAALFAARDIPVGQILLTKHDTAHRQAYLHARDTMERLMALDVVPIVNENDTVAVDEIRFGDNDTLAALVAAMIGAELVVLLTDIEGLYDADPRADERAQLLEHVDELTEQLLAAAGDSVSNVGSGGMITKLEAAKVLMQAGVPMVVCDGRRPDVVVDAVEGKPVGTLFAGGAARIKGRKLWIALGQKTAGEVVVDDGARDALCQRGKSLLPIGVVEVEGTFKSGDAIVLRDRAGAEIARGLTDMSSSELEAVKGMNSAEIAERIPALAGKEVIHRDHLVIL